MIAQKYSKSIDGNLKMTAHNFLKVFVFGAFIFGMAPNTNAQEYRNSRMAENNGAHPMSHSQYPPVIRDNQVRMVSDYSWIHIDPPEPKSYKVNDIVTMIVSEKSEVTLQSIFNRQKTSSLKAELKDFIRIGAGGNLENAAANAPTIDAGLTGRINATGQVNESEGITFRIAATIVDILPNGNLVLEAKKTISTDDDKWIYTLTGVARFNDIQANNTILSENIANLDVAKFQSGKTSDSTKRYWGVKIFDKLWPF